MANRNPLETLLDVVVYAPLGAALTVSEELPNLAEKGREALNQLNQRFGAARVVGQFAVKQGRREAERRFQASRDGGRRDRARGDTASRNGAEPAEPLAGDDPAMDAPGEPVAGRPGPPVSQEVDQGEVHLLAIPGYDSLSAPQVVQRLAGLSAEEREAVRTYEATHRRRQTILARVAQLHDQQ